MSLYELGCFKQGSRQRYKRPKPNTLLKKMKKKITKSKMHITPTKILQWIFFIAHPKLRSPVCLCTKDAARGHVVAPGNHAGLWRVNWWEKIGIWEREITALVLLNTISNLKSFPSFYFSIVSVWIAQLRINDLERISWDWETSLIWSNASDRKAPQPKTLEGLTQLIKSLFLTTRSSIRVHRQDSPIPGYRLHCSPQNKKTRNKQHAYEQQSSMAWSPHQHSIYSDKICSMSRKTYPQTSRQMKEHKGHNKPI